MISTNINDIQEELTEKINYTDIVDNCESEDSQKPLSANQGKFLKGEIENSITSVSMNAKTGVFTFVKNDGTSFTLDTLLEKVVVNFRYDQESEKLILTHEDGTTQEISMSAFINLYTGSNGTEIIVSIVGNKISATIKDCVIGETKLSADLLAKINGKADTSSFGATAFSNNYNDLDNLPNIPNGAILYDIFGQNTNGAITQKATTDALNTKKTLIPVHAGSNNVLSSYWFPIWRQTIEIQDYQDIAYLVNLGVGFTHGSNMYGMFLFTIRHETGIEYRPHLHILNGTLNTSQFKIYYNFRTGLFELWANCSHQYGFMSGEVLSIYGRTAGESYLYDPYGEWINKDFETVQTPTGLIYGYAFIDNSKSFYNLTTGVPNGGRVQSIDFDYPDSNDGRAMIRYDLVTSDIPTNLAYLSRSVVNTYNANKTTNDGWVKVNMDKSNDDVQPCSGTNYVEAIKSSSAPIKLKPNTTYKIKFFNVEDFFGNMPTPYIYDFTNNRSTSIGITSRISNNNNTGFFTTPSNLSTNYELNMELLQNQKYKFKFRIMITEGTKGYDNFVFDNSRIFEDSNGLNMLNSDGFVTSYFWDSPYYLIKQVFVVNSQYSQNNFYYRTREGAGRTAFDNATWTNWKKIDSNEEYHRGMKLLATIEPATTSNMSFLTIIPNHEDSCLVVDCGGGWNTFDVYYGTTSTSTTKTSMSSNGIIFRNYNGKIYGNSIGATSGAVTQVTHLGFSHKVKVYAIERK